jgi:hypothetical protein
MLLGMSRVEYLHGRNPYSAILWNTNNNNNDALNLQQTETVPERR